MPTTEHIYQSILHELSLVPPTRLADIEAYLKAISSDVSLERRDAVPNQKKPVFGSAKGKYALSPDFDAPLNDFKDYAQ